MQQLVARWGAPVVTASFLTVGIQTLVNLAAEGDADAAAPLHSGAHRGLDPLGIPVRDGGIRDVRWLAAGVRAVTDGRHRPLVVLLAGLAGYIVWQVRHRNNEGEHEPANPGS